MRSGRREGQRFGGNSPSVGQKGNRVQGKGHPLSTRGYESYIIRTRGMDTRSAWPPRGRGGESYNDYQWLERARFATVEISLRENSSLQNVKVL